MAGYLQPETRPHHDTTWIFRPTELRHKSSVSWLPPKSYIMSAGQQIKSLAAMITFNPYSAYTICLFDTLNSLRNYVSAFLEVYVKSFRIIRRKQHGSISVATLT